MASIKNVGVKELKNRLSEYLRDVRRGARILVSDRNTVVAELHEPGGTYAVPESWEPGIADWIRDGIVTPPTRKKKALEPSPIALEEGAALRLIEEDRGGDGR